MRVKLFGVVGLLSLFAACGGDDADKGHGVAPVSAHGTLVLPAGVTLDPASLSVTAGVDTAPIDADGTFTLKVLPPEAGPVQVDVLDADGDLVLIGLVDPAADATAPNEASVATTAAALAVTSLGGFTLPTESQGDVWSIVRAAPATATLATALADAMATDPKAVSAGSDALTTALGTAHDALLGAAAAATAHAFQQPRYAASESDVVIQPSAQQSGVEVVHNPAGTGIVAQNSFRRPAEMLAYRTSYTDADDKVHDITPPEQVGDAIDVHDTQHLGLLTAVGDALTGKAPWSPTLSAPLVLPMVGGAKKTQYDVIVLGPASAGITPDVFSDPKYAGMIADWNSRLDVLAVEHFFANFAAPFLEAFMFGAPASIAGTNLKIQSANFAGILERHARDILQTIKSNARYATALEAMSQGLIGNQALRDELVQFIVAACAAHADDQAAFAAATQRLEALSKAATMVAAVDLFLQAGDVGAVLKDLGSSKNAEVWSATVAPAVVRLDPPNATVSQSSATVGFKAALRDNPNAAPGTLLYRWTAGPQGLVGDYVQGTAQTLDTTSDSAFYLAQNPLAIDEHFSDTLTVDVFKDDGSHVIPADKSTRLGGATATITGQARTLDSSDGELQLVVVESPGTYYHRIGCLLVHWPRVSDPGATYSFSASGCQDYSLYVTCNTQTTEAQVAQAITDDGYCGYLTGPGGTESGEVHRWSTTWFAAMSWVSMSGNGSTETQFDEELQVAQLALANAHFTITTTPGPTQ